MVRKLLRQPNEFMENKVGQPKLRREFVVLLVIGALGTVGQAYIGMQILSASDAETLRFPVYGLALDPLISIVALWILYTVGLHFIANNLGGRGPIRRLLKLVPWALLPIGLGNLLKSITTYIVYQDIDVSGILNESGQQFPVRAVANAGADDPLAIIGSLVLIAMIIWAGYLMSFAVQNAKNIPHDDAIKAVAVPVAIHILYALWGVLGAVGVL